jgi:hypothetical protein
MGAGSPAGPHAPSRVQLLNGTLYLFKYHLTGYAPKLIVSAHGGQGASPATFPLKGKERLLFYSAHGNAAPGRSLYFAAGMRDVGESESKPIEELAAPTQSHNYRLVKYQGVHSAEGETYEKLQRMQEASAATFKRMTKNPHKLWKKSATVVPDQYLTDADLPDVRDPLAFDILTIRNRAYSTVVTLDTVMSEVRKLSHAYEQIHCSFCRS